MELRADLNKAKRNVLASMLEQYEKDVKEGIEAEVKDIALAAVEEEARILRYHAQQRLVSIESEVRQMMESFLTCAQEHLFQRINAEMDATLEELDTRMRSVLGREPSGKPSAPAPAANKVVETPPPVEPARNKQEPEAPSDNSQLYQNEVSLSIHPPVPLESLLHFYRSLWQIPELSVVRSEGSADKGMVVVIRLAEPTALLKHLGEMRSIGEVHDTSSLLEEGSQRTISVELKAPAAVGDEANEQP